ncbi:IS66 family insertion sequence element accessory protein TnpA [Gracilibacillus dipsosauri]|uniref:IS66 family insertion sequence element accessory protein TnpA n=1 Tax=Gracilibacillus dipsosauri TaxID=178340 RepID=UPI0024092E88
MSDKQLEWQSRMDQWRESGLSIAAWCRQENIHTHQMYYWKRRFDQQSASPSAIDWLEISTSANNDTDASLVIKIDKLVVEVKPHIDRQLLSDVLHLLKYT